MDRTTCFDYDCLLRCKQINGVNQVNVLYDYEIYAQIQLAELTDAIAEVESSMLYETAMQLNVDNCSPVQPGPQNSFSQLLDGAMISSLAWRNADQPSEVACSSNETPPEGTTCIPVSGDMKVIYAGNQDAELERGIKDAVLKVIEKGAQNNVFVTGRIEKIDYVGSGEEAIIVTSGIGQNGEDSIKSTTAFSGIGIGSIAAACIAMVAGAVLLVKKMSVGGKKESYIRTPSPNAGKKNGLRAYDSESVRTDFDDVCFNIDGSQSRKTRAFDPYELQVDPEAPSILLENNLNAMNKNTALSTISEVSKETGSTKSGARMAIIGSSPHSSPLQQSFTRILSESTYSDGIHSLHNTIIDENEFVEFTGDHNEDGSTLFGEQINTPGSLNTLTPKKKITTTPESACSVVTNTPESACSVTNTSESAIEMTTPERVIESTP